MSDHDEVPRAARLRAARGTLLVDATTVEVTRALNAVGIQPILLKGPTFASWLYPEGGRTYTDSDLLVRSTDVPAAEASLSRLGFVATQAGYAPSERDIESSTYSRRGTVEAPNIVDLHWNLHLARDPDLTWSVLHAEVQEMSLGGTPITILNVPARALHVAIHAAQHGLMGPQRFERGGQTGEDLRRALRVVARGDWIEAKRLASAIGASDAFAFGLRLDPTGAALADELSLDVGEPELWRFRNPFEVPRGASSFHRLVAAPTVNEKTAVLFRAIVPSRARVRRVANSSMGRASLVGAYVEYWFDAARAIVPAVTSGIALRRSSRAARRR